MEGQQIVVYSFLEFIFGSFYFLNCSLKELVFFDRAYCSTEEFRILQYSIVFFFLSFFDSVPSTNLHLKLPSNKLFFLLCCTFFDLATQFLLILLAFVFHFLHLIAFLKKALAVINLERRSPRLKVETIRDKTSIVD